MLMDAGCEYYGYVSDVTRTWPVNGEFTAAQKTLFEVVRVTKEKCTQVCVQHGWAISRGMPPLCLSVCSCVGKVSL